MLYYCMMTNPCTLIQTHTNLLHVWEKKPIEWASRAHALSPLGRSRAHVILYIYSPCLFQLFGAYGHQKLLRTAKRSAFQVASIKFVWVKIIQNQHKHIIGWVVAIVRIHHFLDTESCEHLYLSPHVILMIHRFFTQSDSLYSQILRKGWSEKS
jgi:hypothetical protein